MTLDDIFSIINLDDVDIQQKVWKLYQSDQSNEFLEEDLYRIAEEYKLILPCPRAPIKVLKKK